MTLPSSTRFLVVGAGGSHGATGNHAARPLLARGLRVRAFVRQADERADELRELGAEIAVGDIRDYEVVRATLDGVQRAYFTYPLADGLLLATATFAAAGKQTGLQSVVNMSQITAPPRHPSPPLPAARWPFSREGHLRRRGKADGFAVDGEHVADHGSPGSREPGRPPALVGR